MTEKASLVLIFFSILLTMPIIFFCTEKKEAVSLHNDLFFDNLIGEVTMVEETPYLLNDTGQISAIDSCCITITEYDDKGYRSRQVNKNNTGNEKNGQTYVSRFENGMPKEIKFMENGTLTSTLLGTLNQTGKPGNTRIYDASGKLDFYYSGIELNEYGKIILLRKFTPDSLLQETIVNNYNKQIWVGGYIKDSSGKEVFSTTISLNEKMNPVEVKQTRMMNTSPDITTTKYAYGLYDNHGNWIKCHEIDTKGNILKVLKRKIIYRQILSSKYQSPVPKD